MTIAYLSLGSNLGSRQEMLAAARRSIYDDVRARMLAESSIYETEPMEKVDQPAFLNQVVAINWSDSAEKLLLHCAGVESELGRFREERYGPRTIDIDILLFGSAIIHTPQLIIPHPRMDYRAFVLVPLSEIAGGIEHPVHQRTIRDMVKGVGHEEGVWRWENP